MTFPCYACKILTKFFFDSIARPTVLLDANVVRYCFKRDGFTAAQLDLLRKTMRELARRDFVRFVITQPRGLGADSGLRRGGRRRI